MDDTNQSLEAVRAALRRDRRYLKFQLPEVTGLDEPILHQLIVEGLFPPAQCHECWGISWCQREVDHWTKEAEDYMIIFLDNR